MSKSIALLAAVIGLALTPLASAAQAQDAPALGPSQTWTVRPAWVRAHASFLASPALRGRGGTTHDETVAATYVASVFERHGLTPPPGMTGYLQTAPVAQAADGRWSVLAPADAARATAATVNALGWLQGVDPEAGVVLISAHLDHLGVVDGVLHAGANDDASGVAAVLELAHALAAGPRLKRSILFVAYGAEELGLLGSKYFVDHPPVPMETLVANLEIEMIGRQDPTLPAGVMMMTGFDRSDFGPRLQALGALIAADPYPEQRFFQRSDNYALALRGIVAHTISGWATIPTYHTAEDTLEALDIPFMTAAIQSLVEPMRALADGDITPAWAPGGRPVPGVR